MKKSSQIAAAHNFLALHRAKTGFVIPNAWDAGSAIILANAGFPAIATTSGGIAFSLGKPDYFVGNPAMGVSREEMFTRIREIVAAVDVPVSADLEAGYGANPDAVADTIRLAIGAGLAGGNIEDRIPGEPALYDEVLAVERIRAARTAIEESGSAFVLNARTDAFVVAQDGLGEAVRRANLYREAGADCVFTPGVPDIDTVRTLMREISPPLNAPGAQDVDAVRTLVEEIRTPLNIVSGLGFAPLDPKALLDAGVARVSLGASMARAVLGFIRSAAREVRERGTIGYADHQIPQGELNALFANARAKEALAGA